MGLMRLVRGRVTLYNSITWWEGDDTLIPSIPEPSVSPLTEESIFWPRLIDRDGRISQDYRVTISQFLRTNHSHGGRTSNILDCADTCGIVRWMNSANSITQNPKLLVQWKLLKIDVSFKYRNFGWGLPRKKELLYFESLSNRCDFSLFNRIGTCFSKKFTRKSKFRQTG